MRNSLKPLKKIDDKYDEDTLKLLISQIHNVPAISNTRELQQCFQLMAHEHAERHYAERLNESTKYRRRLAPKLWRWFVAIYPKIADDYFCGVEYRMCGGRGDPRGRYILIPKDDDNDEWSDGDIGFQRHISVAPYNRPLRTVVEEKIIESNRSIIPHQTVTKINRDIAKLEQLKRQVQAKKTPMKVYLHRSSSYNGFRDFCAQHRLGNAIPPPVFSFVENGVTHLAFCYSARRGDILEYPPLLNKLLDLTPTEIIFETEDRIGREYAEDTIKLLREIGFKITIEDKEEKYDSGWQHPYKSRIQIKNKDLARNYLVPESRIHSIKESKESKKNREEGIRDIKEILLTSLKRIGSHYVCNSSVAKILGLARGAKTLFIDKFDNLTAKIKTLALSKDTNTYYISSA